MKKLLCCVVFASILALGTAWADGSAMDKDVLLVGTESTFKPFEFRNEANEIVGFDMDMISIIAEKLGKKVEVVDMAFDALIPSLLTGKIDIIAAGMSATPERAKRVAFSQVYYRTPDGFTVKADRDDISSLEDTKGKVVAVQLGTIQDAFFSKMGGVEIKRYQKTDDAFREVLLGRADVACVDGTVTKDNLASNKDYIGKLKIAFFHPTSDNGMALAMSLKDPALLEKVDEALKDIMSGEQYKELKEKWNID
ncbi:MAG: transporter substrate-binding domain-containing protein [Synergistales bacterium]|nr:transporter substrate-binding domain-containing protein [Dethiosulfovibrio sp.]NCC95837.1 transporter substrate-binding domain-containing protein [Synergistales bacterium]